MTKRMFILIYCAVHWKEELPHKILEEAYNAWDSINAYMKGREGK